MGFFTPKIVDKTLDLVGKGTDLIDKGFLTKQEIATNFLEYYKLTLNESTERSQARRQIAIEFIRFYLGFFLFVALVYGLSKVLQTWDLNGQPYMEYGNILKDIAVEFNLHWGFLVVMGFFFGTYVVGKMKGGQ